MFDSTDDELPLPTGLDAQESLAWTGPEWLLGFAEERKDVSELLRHRFPSKLGGRPAWLDPVDIPHEEQLRCPATGRIMNFLLQIYAPVFDIDEAFHRTIFLFVSPKGSEVCQTGGCVAFRSQLKRENQFYSPMPPLNTETIPRRLLDNCVVADPWKVDLYEASFTEDCFSVEVPEEIIVFPEFNISIQEEFVDVASSGELPSSNLDENVADLPAEEIKAAEKMLTAEQKDFMDFENRISSAPSQCIRYCFDDGAEPLWPNKQHPRIEKIDVPNCERCGAPRKFEFQVLPQLIHYLGVDESLDGEGYDWGTIVVYSCSESCDPQCHQPPGGRGSEAYAREFVFVQPM